MISRDELHRRLGELTVVDTQHPNMFRRRHLPNAVNLPRQRVEALAPVLLHDLDAEIVVYCGSWLCRSSDHVAERLRALGYTNVRVYRGGRADWRRAGLPIVRSTQDTAHEVRVVDLTHAFDNGMPVFPGLPDPSFEPIAKVEDDGYAMTRYAMLNHIGTHVDAPAHQIAGGDTLDEIGLERLVTEALTIDVSHRHPHGMVSLDELAPHLDDVRENDVVLFYSNNARNYGTDAYWTGWSYPDADAARALIERGISAIGFDGPSADPVDTTTFDLHRVWLSAGRMILENVNNLDQLPRRVRIVVAPMKVARANGAPTRIFALLD